MTLSPSASLPGTFPFPASSPILSDEDERSGKKPIRSAQKRRKSSSVQARRSVVSLGLGVSFAPLTTTGELVSSPQSTSTASLASLHSRQSSVSFSSPVAHSPEEPPFSPTLDGSRHASRRPSLTHLASFLSGIEHHTRVRSPGINGGRGVSRSASRSTSRAGDRRSGYRDEARSRAGSRASSRRSSIVLSGTESTWDLQDDEAVLEEEPTTPAAVDKKRYSTLAPRPYSSEPEEEPFLDTAPSSPSPPLRKLRAASTRSDASYGYGQSSLQGVDVFDPGERVGVGVWLEGRGGWTRDCFADAPGKILDTLPGNGVDGPAELEVVRRLGEGTYAIVYLVREVLFNPDPNEDDGSILSPIDPFSSFVFDTTATTPTATRPRFRSWASDPFLPPPEPNYGRNFALKCLCKKDLTQELIEVQRGEAVLHRSLPDHEFIVRLYGAYETDDWLFLVLEYCPGQDLYYWLDERADDSEALYDATSPFQSPFGTNGRNSFDFERPITNGKSHSPDEEALSRTITASTAAGPLAELHDSTPPSPSLLAATADSTLLSRKRLRLISRMFGQMCSAVQACHDAGISHRDIKPENFIVMDGRGGDIGMGTTAGEGAGAGGKVVVKITDWGLGTTDTVCEDFDCGSKPYMAYECRNNLAPSYDPRQADVWSLGLVLLNLLYHRNPWSDPCLEDPDFAAYVADQHGFFQERFEGIGDEVAHFLADRVFCDVLEKDASGKKFKRRVSAGEFGRWATRLVMMMGEGDRRSAHVSQSTVPLVYGVSRPGPGHGVPSVSGPSLLSQLAPFASSPSPTSKAEDLPADLQASLGKVSLFGGSHDSLGSLPEVPEGSGTPFASEFLQRTPPLLVNPSHSFPSPKLSLANAHRLPEDDDSLPSPSFPSSSVSSSPHKLSNGDAIINGNASYKEDQVEDEPVIDGEELPVAAKSKRRKRGARRGRAMRPADDAPSPAPPVLDASPRDKTLDELAAASQDLARELSKTKRSTGTQSASSSVSRTNTSVHSNASDKKSTRGSVFGKMRGLVMDGNSDLNALRQRAAARDAPYGARGDIVSAPAKMQGRDDTLSGRISHGTSSVGSWSANDSDERSHTSSTHWSSTTSRRDRQQKRRHGDFSPTSSANGTFSPSTFDPRTPISSFSSAGSSDWRRDTPRGGLTSSRPHTGRLYDERRDSSDQVAKAKPKLKDASIDTADLGASARTLGARPINIPPASRPAAAPSVPANMTRAPSVKSHASSSTVEAPVKTKLAKVLNSISVFNRSQDR